MIERVLPARLHRALMPLAHLMRHYWRCWRKPPIAGVSVIIANSEGEILLLRHSYGPPVWGLPGGGLKEGEDPAQCARREVLEEVGIALGQLTLVSHFAEVISGAPHTAHVFAARSDAEPRPDMREVIAARFFPPDRLPEELGPTMRRRIAAWRDAAAMNPV
ncbi:NUDIX domain-containing protein [Qipengyuania nanhaisediminis]|uniref:NUDIX domain-containing protein n=1 Tax=Qipengyuania nanhaisediminis TaxID=604088 RepID=UPI0038B2D49F